MRAKELTSLGLVVLITAAARAAEPTLLENQKILESAKFIELTHAFEPGIPRWPGFPDEKAGDGVSVRKRPRLARHGIFNGDFYPRRAMGTHVDPPAHFIKGIRTVDQISPKEMILALVVSTFTARWQKIPITH